MFLRVVGYSILGLLVGTVIAVIVALVMEATLTDRQREQDDLRGLVYAAVVMIGAASGLFTGSISAIAVHIRASRRTNR